MSIMLKDYLEESCISTLTLGQIQNKPKKPRPPQQIAFEGYRQTLRRRMTERGDNSLTDRDLIEFVLFRLMPRADTRPIAKALLDRFGSIAEILGAPPVMLVDIPGITQVVAQDIHALLLLAQRYLKGGIGKGPSLSSWKNLIDYCRATVSFGERRQLHAIFLNRHYRLIKDECQQVGTVDYVTIYPREIVRRALELSASYVVLASYCPWNNPLPSQAEIRSTNLVKKAAGPFDILLADHILIGKNGHFSMRAERLI